MLAGVTALRRSAGAALMFRSSAVAWALGLPAAAGRIAVALRIHLRAAPTVAKTRRTRILEASLTARLPDRELRDWSRGLLRFDPRKAGANQRPVQPNFFRCPLHRSLWRWRGI